MHKLPTFTTSPAQDRFNMSVSMSPTKSQRRVKPRPTSPRDRRHTYGRAGTPVTGISTESAPSETAVPESTEETEEPLLAELSKDRQVLKEHEAALKRLEELQKNMIGGEKAGMYMCMRLQ